MSTAREEILGKLRQAKHQVPDEPESNEPVFPPIALPLENAFKNQLESISGKVYLLNDEKELFDTLKQSISEFDPATVFCNEAHLFPMLKDAGIGFQQYEGPQNPVEIGITACEFLIARSGTVMVSSAQGGGRQLSVYPPVHIVIARKNQLVESLEEAYSGILEKYNDNLPSQIALITGPSRTADIEKTLVLGAHGPKEIRVFLLT
jgi:L-lactate dehydrogenase complex protein LldG